MTTTELRELLSLSAPRPWHMEDDYLWSSSGGRRGRHGGYGIGEIHDDVDKDIIVAAINALPALLDVVDAAKAVNREVDAVSGDEQMVILRQALIKLEGA